MVQHRRYSQREKLSAVIASELSGVTAVAEQTGIPHQTISYWMADPAFSEVRRKTREDLAEEIKVVAHLAWGRIAKAMPDMEPRDAVFAAEKATTLLLLLTGSATSRTETRDITGTLSDGDLDDAIATLEDIVRTRSTASEAGEVRQS